MSSTDPLDADAAEVLRRSWSITRDALRVSTGTSRDTWTIDDEFWLSHADLGEAIPFRREADLLHHLPAEIKRCAATWRVPEVVLAVDGQTTAASVKGIWRLTRRLPGDQLDPGDPSTYVALPRMLADLHRVLGKMSHGLRVREHGIVERAPELVELYATRPFASATDDSRELFAVRTAAEWLAPRVRALAAQPRQLTHGDWIPPNLRITANGWGVLDWEFCRVDPVIMDLAQSCCTILIWSGLDAVSDRIEALLERYSMDSRRVVSPGCVRSAMMLYWLHNYHYWRERHEATGRYEAHLARQPSRLLAVGKFLGV